MANLYSHRDANIRKTWLLMASFLIFIIFLGWLFGLVFENQLILYGAVVLSLLMNVLAYWHSDKIALAMSGARPVTREQNPYLYRLVENLCITAGLPVPRICVIDSAQINAFATGRNPKHSAIAVTTGAIEKLQNEELEGVLAHELSHIGNRDILVSSVAVVLAGVIAVLADIFLRAQFWGRDDDHRGNAVILAVAIVAAVLAPLAATLIRLAISRKREYLADASGVLLTRYPDGLANALTKISNDESQLRTAHNATAHLFIANPFKGKAGASWFAKLFLTHPPLNDRIRVLKDMRT